MILKSFLYQVTHFQLKSSTDGLNYKQINHLNTKYTTIGEKPLGLTWETKVAQFIHSYTNKFTPLYRFCQALYAGMCLLTLLLLPTNAYSILSNQQVPVLEINELFINQTVLFIQPDSSVGNQSYDHFNLFSFIMYYSTYASSFSYFFQLMSLINVIGSLRLLEKGRDPSVSYTRDNIIRFLLSWMSCICNSSTIFNLSFFL
ncbi:hypothetical protein BC833DRAFT_240067 [Globomyces pollinis-pini]|nr:hypothetical protein BC833DRAFT_240067 [Globomyces pollinis-pini]